MNILFYQHQYPAFGGIETVTTLLAGQFAREGHRVGIVSFVEKQGTGLLATLPSSVQWIKMPSVDIADPQNGVAFKAIVQRFRPDFIIFQDSYAPLEHWLDRAYVGDVPIIVVEHNMPRVSPCFRIDTRSIKSFVKSLVACALFPYFYRKRFTYERNRRVRLYTLATKYTFLSPSYIPLSNRIAGMEGGTKLCAIPNPNRPTTIDPNLNEKKNEVIFCGSLIPRKGVNRILSAWSRLEQKFPAWSLHIVGGGPLRDKLTTKSAQLGLQRVVFEGFTTDTERWYHDASVIMMASDVEGWPMVLGEAMQQGCVPVVYNSFAACQDIVASGKDGILVPAFDEPKYVAELEKILVDADYRQALQRNAIRQSERFSLPMVSRMWYDLFAELKK